MTRWQRPLLCLMLLATFFVGVRQRGVTGAETAAARIFQAAQPVYRSLTAEQKLRACFGFDAAEKAEIRLTPNFDRPGFPVGRMSAEQKEMALKLLQSALSERGWKKIKGIMDQPRNQGAQNWDYCLAFFGEPTENGSWGFRWEGHHVSITIDIINGKVGKFRAALLGSNPIEGKVADPLATEAQLGRDIISQLTDEQKQKATLAAGAGTLGAGPIPARREGGVMFSELSTTQQKLGERLIEETLNYFPPEMTHAPRAVIQKAGGIQACRFLLFPKENFWAVRGPAFVCEYSTSTGHPHLTFQAE
ncbi:MAG: DUF3500 domain-containing protein [Abditibacteriales bacterium]|nr:DUF3500 domain-containing protein [Abditibacteriales bacterium]